MTTRASTLLRFSRASAGFASTFVLTAASCGTTAPPKVVAAEPVAAVPEVPKIEYEKLGRPVKLGVTIELLGAEAVWIEGQPVIVSLEGTAWDTLDDVRTGRAKLRVMHDGKEQVVTVSEGNSKSAFGYGFAVEYAFELYKEPEYKPHCKLVITRQ